MSWFEDLKSKFGGPSGKMERFIVDDQVIEKAVEDGDLFSVIDPVWYSVNIYDSKADYENSLKPFSLAQRYIHAIEWYTAEVNNGGHDQFYDNSTGIVWQNALAGYRFFKLPELENVLQASIDTIGELPGFEREKRWEQLDRLEPNFDTLDDAFYAIKPKHEEAVLAYIAANREEFYFDDEVFIEE